MKSRSDCPAFDRSTRRTATVTISVPETSWQRRMTSNDGYFPVPTISRDRNERPPSTRGSSHIAVSSFSAPALHRVDDLHPVALAQDGRRVGRPRRHLAVERHRRELAAHLQLPQELLEGGPAL